MRLYLILADKNRLLDLPDGQYLVGRSAQADIRIDRREVSLRHAMLRVSGDRLFVADLGSRNGTSVGDVKVDAGGREVEVKPDGTIMVANLPLSRRDPATRSHNGSTHTFIDARSYYREGQGLVGLSSGTIGQMLSALFALVAADGLSEGFEDQACQFVGRWIRCDRAALFLDHGPGSQLEVWGWWSRSDAEARNLALGQMIVEEVCDQRASLLLNSPGSLIDDANGMAAAMAVPLFDNERVRGILYCDAESPKVQYTNADLEALTATANAIAVKLRNRDLEQELSVARRIQHGMCFTVRPTIPGYEVAARLESCFAVGGDFFHIGNVIDGKVLVALGDVAGKGLPAALAMAACAVLIPALARYCQRPCAIVEELDRSLKGKISRERYVSLFLGELDLAEGELTYINAGHVPPLIVRASGTAERLESTGGLVGICADFACRSERTWLCPGDLLAVFSDGVTDATIHGDEFYGREKAEALVLAHRDQDLRELQDRIFTEIAGFLRGGHSSDDTTLLMLRRQR